MNLFSKSKNKLSDAFFVNYSKKVFFADIKNLFFLYQPIVGRDAISVYLTLLNYVPSFLNKNEKNSYFHKTLFTILNIKESEFLLAKSHLEAFGLIRTNLLLENNTIEYVVNVPLPPDKFFDNEILNKVLYLTVGKDTYYFIKENSLNYIEGKEIFKEKTNISSGIFDIYSKGKWTKILNSKIDEEHDAQKTLEIDLFESDSNEPSCNNYLSFYDQLKKSNLLDIKLNTNIIIKIFNLKHKYKITDWTDLTESLKVAIVNKKIDFDIFEDNLKEIYNSKTPCEFKWNDYNFTDEDIKFFDDFMEKNNVDKDFINSIIFYCSKKNYHFSKNYFLTIANSFIAKKITSGSEVYEKLTSILKKTEKK
ncbi:DnaD domain protein [symbiont of Argiope bruennichi]|uniref:hypothetical protein n=1 Tax=symbiont of Argiope bruennichi TaxID=2810479 RepID=UPI003DA49D50